MTAYTLPRETFELLLNALGERQKAEAFAKAIESAICAIDEKAKEAIIDKKEHIKIELKEELKNELASKADVLLVKAEILLVRQEMQTIKVGLEGKIEAETSRLEGKIDTETSRLEGRIARLDQKFNFMIILMIIALTLMNPVVAEIIKKALKL